MLSNFYFMYVNKQIPNRQEGEELVLFLRRHGIILVSHFIIFTLLALVPVGLYIFLSQFYADLMTGEIYKAIQLLVVSLYYLFLILFFYNSFIDYYLDVWIVTSRRIINIEQKGLFNRMISEHELDKIQDVSAQQKGIWQTFFTYGNVNIQTAGEVPMFTFRQVDNPFEIAKTINHLLQQVGEPQTSAARTEYWNRVSVQGEKAAPPPKSALPQIPPDVQKQSFPTKINPWQTQPQPQQPKPVQSNYPQQPYSQPTPASPIQPPRPYPQQPATAPAQTPPTPTPTANPFQQTPAAPTPTQPTYPTPATPTPAPEDPFAALTQPPTPPQPQVPPQPPTNPQPTPNTQQKNPWQ